MHQPYRLRRYSVFDTDADYFDDPRNRKILLQVADRCYRPLTARLLEMIQRHDGRFRLTLGITGALVEQLRADAPDVIESLRALADTACVELVNQPYYHALAFLYSRDEFRQQMDMHAAMVLQQFGLEPGVFCNTELIYNNDLASYLEAAGRFRGVLSEGADSILEHRSPNETYRPPHCRELTVLLRNYRLSDDIAFRFSNRHWPGWPLTAEKFAESVSAIGEGHRVCNLFMDGEAFGEHQSADTGIFDFLDALPGAILADSRNSFTTVGEAIESAPPADEFDAPHMISWADTERDLSAWLGNAMQSNALHELYKLEGPIKAGGDEALLRDWRRLTTSDHFYYMCTKYFADGDVHRYFNPYESPYDSYINFMNVLDNLRSRLTR